jgi:ABC-type phosphate transport system substrate-binding protein
MAIVVNKANATSKLSLGQLKRIFTKQERVWPNGEPVVPVDWEAASEVRKFFSRRVLGKTVVEMRDYWLDQSITTGVNPPSTLKTARAVVRFVASVPGAISYLPEEEADDSVKLIPIPE